MNFEWDPQKAEKNLSKPECHLRKQAQFLMMSLPSLFLTPIIQLKKTDLLLLDGRTDVDC